MDIMLSQEDYRHVAEAISMDLKLSHRITDTVRTLADHLRASARNLVDSLTVGTMATDRAEDALLEELVVQVLVGAQIVTERHSHIRYKIRERKACEARRIADVLFEERKGEMADRSRLEWAEFVEWRNARRRAPVDVEKEPAPKARKSPAKSSPKGRGRKSK